MPYIKNNVFPRFVHLALPEILASDFSNKRVYESTPVSFEVTAQGIPKPEAEWFHNGKPLKADDHVKLTEEGDKYKLSIAETKLSDEGTFKVVIKNKLGEVSKQADLSVMRKFPIFMHKDYYSLLLFFSLAKIQVSNSNIIFFYFAQPLLITANRY